MSLIKIAHRGGAGLMPENTLPAFENAIDLGFDAAELDVRLTKDARVVVYHDAKLNPGFCKKKDGRWVTRADSIAISELTYEELLDYEVGWVCPQSKYAKSHPNRKNVDGAKIPLLTEVIELVQSKSPSFWLVVELKSQSIGDREQLLVNSVVDIVNQYCFAERIIFCSFNWSILTLVSQQAPEIKRWYLTPKLSKLKDKSAQDTMIFSEELAPRYIARAIAEAGGDGWFFHCSDIKIAAKATSKADGLRRITWGNCTLEMAELLSYGIDGACLNLL